jgi:NAD(P)H-dependent FMN reductase
MASVLKKRGHVIHVVDPVAEKLPLLVKPHFAYAPQLIPDQLQVLADKLKDSDAFVCCTPEYNHAPSPALLNMLNHFGSSLFSFKPSLIVSYSAGQWGGTRAAHALRPTLSELGCLPVSAMIHIPKAGEALDENGVPQEDAERWIQYLNRGVSQLEWWGVAAREHRAVADPFSTSPILNKEPSQRNAP